MLATIWFLAIALLLVVAWRRFGLGASPLWRVAIVALVAGVALTGGLYLAWRLQPPTNPPGLLVMFSDAALLFPLVAVVGPNIRLIGLLAPMLMAVEVSAMLLLIMAVARWAGRAIRRSAQQA